MEQTKSKRRYPGWVRLLAVLMRWLVAPLMRLYAVTWRLDVRGMELLDNLNQGKGGIIVAWHGDMIVSIHALRDKGLVGLVSPVWEGELIGQVMRGFGFRLIRGSSGTSPTAGLKASLRVLKSGGVVASILDGPEGPAHIAKPGALFMASLSGKPILLMASAVHPCITASSWDRQRIPLPWSRVAVRVGAPFEVPHGISHDDIPALTIELTSRIDALEAEAREAVGG